MKRSRTTRARSKAIASSSLTASDAAFASGFSSSDDETRRAFRPSPGLQFGRSFAVQEPSALDHATRDQLSALPPVITHSHSSNAAPNHIHHARPPSNQESYSQDSSIHRTQTNLQSERTQQDSPTSCKDQPQSSSQYQENGNIDSSGTAVKPGNCNPIDQPSPSHSPLAGGPTCHQPLSGNELPTGVAHADPTSSRSPSIHCNSSQHQQFFRASLPELPKQRRGVHSCSSETTTFLDTNRSHPSDTRPSDRSVSQDEGCFDICEKCDACARASADICNGGSRRDAHRRDHQHQSGHSRCALQCCPTRCLGPGFRPSDEPDEPGSGHFEPGKHRPDQAEKGLCGNSGLPLGHRCSDHQGMPARDSGGTKRNGQGSLEIPPQDSLDIFMSSLDTTAELAQRQSKQSTLAGGLDGDEADSPGPPLDSGNPFSEPLSESRSKSFSSVERITDKQPLYHAKDLILPRLDHSAVVYPDIIKNIYVPLPRLSNCTEAHVLNELQSCGVHVVSPGNVPLCAPLTRFHDLAMTLPTPLCGEILSRFTYPTLVQRCIVPIALKGSDIIAVASTGSGKTLAYGIPLLAHVHAQNRPDAGIRGAGPTAIVVSPTRELTIQVSSVLRNLGKTMNIGVATAVGGMSKYEQFKQLRDGGSAVVVFTPGRFIDMVKMKACSLLSVSFVVVDEADRMFGMGFGTQLHQILGQVRPDAQKMFVSATFPKECKDLVAVYTRNAVHIIFGRTSEVEFPSANPSGADSQVVDRINEKITVASAVPLVADTISEYFVSMLSESHRLSWLMDHIRVMVEEGLVIIFCATRSSAAALANHLRGHGVSAACIHGETDPDDRSDLMRLFRKGDVRLLVATDIAARGLDIHGVRTVVNFEPAKNWDDHVHRSGRTGRAGTRGSAFTLLSDSNPRDIAFARSANYSLKSARVVVPTIITEILGSAAIIRSSNRSDRTVESCPRVEAQSRGGRR